MGTKYLAIFVLSSFSLPLCPNTSKLSFLGPSAHHLTSPKSLRRQRRKGYLRAPRPRVRAACSSPSSVVFAPPFLPSFRVAPPPPVMPHWPSKTVTTRLIRYIKSVKVAYNPYLPSAQNPRHSRGAKVRESIKRFSTFGVWQLIWNALTTQHNATQRQK